MSFYPQAVNRDWIPKSGIYAVLNRLQSSLTSPFRTKQRKYDDFILAVRFLSGRSIFVRGGYAAFIGLDDNDPNHFAAVYIDTLRAEYDPNYGRHLVYHIAYVLYGDDNAIFRTLQQRNSIISGNTYEITGASALDGTVSAVIFNAANVTGTGTKAQIISPVGINNGILPPGIGPSIPGTPNAIYANNPRAVG